MFPTETDIRREIQAALLGHISLDDLYVWINTDVLRTDGVKEPQIALDALLIFYEQQHGDWLENEVRDELRKALNGEGRYVDVANPS